MAGAPAIRITSEAFLPAAIPSNWSSDAVAWEPRATAAFCWLGAARFNSLDYFRKLAIVIAHPAVLITSFPRSGYATILELRILIFSDIHNDWKTLETLLSVEADYYIAAGDQVTWSKGSTLRQNPAKARRPGLRAARQSRIGRTGGRRCASGTAFTIFTSATFSWADGTAPDSAIPIPRLQYARRI